RAARASGGWGAGAGCPAAPGGPAPGGGGAPAASWPPVAWRRTRVGPSACTRATRAAWPAASLGTCHCSPLGRTATSRWAFATSMPIHTGGASLMPLASLLSSPVLPQPCRIRAPSPGNCSGSDGDNRGDLRSPAISADPRGIGLPQQPLLLLSSSHRSRYKGRCRGSEGAQARCIYGVTVCFPAGRPLATSRASGQSLVNRCVLCTHNTHQITRDELLVRPKE